ncbi:TIGR00266 family protein [Oceanispirochaeta crateris]|uniref:TIGR00266 family protein n=1 Tax=Oceanispirochaeta crateris TaxID=2518645 RepID=A0A5C1QF40_9SPIO|nr:TIGR00266 family protein [Oceanispirochaeta crateris]QEN06713.1 TIGR00266 family protein [Oceanispirochaeta crateris]
MKVEIQKAPSNSAAKVVLEAGQSFTAEGGAMIAMSGDMQIETSISRNEGGAKGFLKGLARGLAGEGLFMNHYTAGSGGGEVYLSTTLPGDMKVLELDGTKSIKVQNSSFVAHSPDVNMTISWGGLKNAFSGENMIWLELSGKGQVVINAFGMLYPVQIDGEYIVDTGNIAAYDDSLDFKISKAGGSWVSSILGGEGLVCRFKGTGTVWCQTHADKTFGASLTPFLTPKKEK